MDVPKPSPAKGPAKGSVDPTAEENFPRNNPTRRSADKHMQEPGNVRPSGDPTPHRRPPTQVADDSNDRAAEGE